MVQDAFVIASVLTTLVIMCDITGNALPSQTAPQGIQT